MPEATIQAPDIKGLTPAITPTNSDDIFVLEGENFAFDSLGPKTPFGSVAINQLPMPINLRRGCQVLQHEDINYLCTNEAIFQIERVSGALTPMLVFEPFQEIYRWTMGFLNGHLFFCHPGIGILYINMRDGTRGLLESPGVPANPTAIVVDNGRLAVMDKYALTWSAPSDGTNFSPQIAGAGAQAISDRIAGDPIMITSYARGVLVWTSEGVMRSEFTGGQAVYRHRGINTEYRPLNSFCVVKLDDETSVILDQRGFFSSRGEAPVPYAPLFNEFLIDELARNDSKLGSNTRCEWDPFSRRIYLSRAFALHGELYNHTYVLYTPLEKWGNWKVSHYGYGHGHWIDASGRLLAFAGTPYTEQAESDESGYVYDSQRHYPEYGQRRRDTTVLGTSLRLGHLPETTNGNLARPGSYAFDGSAPSAVNIEPLNASVTIGFFRIRSDIFADQMTQIQSILISNVESREIATTDVDYNVIPDGVSDADYNIGVGGQDLGINPVSFVNFGLTSVGSIDGASVFTQTTPTLSRFAKATRFYAGGANGIWHSLKLDAKVAGDYVHLRHLQITATPSGRLL